MKMPKFVVAAFFLLLTAAGVHATIGVGLQAQLGNPTGAIADPNNHSHYLLEHPEYTLDFNDNLGEPNWVSWDLTTDDLGGSGRANNFIPDPTLPTTFYAVVTGDYTGSGYDRGHMCPSADRTKSTTANMQTFYLTNMVPQAANNNA